MNVETLRIQVMNLRELLPEEALTNARQVLERNATLLQQATTSSANEAVTEALDQLRIALDHIERAQHYTADTGEKLASYVTGL